MTPEDLRHLRAVGRPANRSTNGFSRLAEIRRTHDRRADDTELFHILAAEVVEAVHRAPGDAQRLPGANLDGRAVNRPGQNTLNAIQDLLVGVVFVGWCRQLLPAGTRTSNTDRLPLESSPVRRNRMTDRPN